MKKIFLFLPLLLLQLAVVAQPPVKEKVTPPPPPPPAAVVAEEREPEVFTIVEQMPQFPGGEDSLLNYIKRNIKYPQTAKEYNTEGTVYVGMVVTEKGEITNVKIMRGLSGTAGSDCDKEAMRVVKSMPLWQPGMQKGRAVRVQYYLPVRFKLN